MKFRISKVALLLAALCLITPSFVSAQEWSTAQKDVWKSVEAYWALDAAGDTSGFLEYFDADYSGWSVYSPLPSDKATAKKFITFEHKNSKTLVANIQPVAIKIHGDIAIVHYYFTQVSKADGEKQKRNNGRWTDILQKKGDKWVLIADHGGSVPSKD
jgi:ketosteroid isomerase-like protein